MTANVKVQCILMSVDQLFQEATTPNVKALFKEFNVST
jgi:hypothetical protein